MAHLLLAIYEMTKRKLSGVDPGGPGIDLIEHVCLRPRMFFPFPESASYRELITYIGGICTGRNPPHGSGSLGGFADYFLSRTNSPDFWKALDEELENKDFLEAAAHLASLIDDWKTETGVD